MMKIRAVIFALEFLLSFLVLVSACRSLYERFKPKK
jgi:hypothetical protein